jgi:hypothetical protein
MKGAARPRLGSTLLSALIVAAVTLLPGVANSAPSLTVARAGVSRGPSGPTVRHETP